MRERQVIAAVVAFVLSPAVVCCGGCIESTPWTAPGDAAPADGTAATGAGQGVSVFARSVVNAVLNDRPDDLLPLFSEKQKARIPPQEIKYLTSLVSSSLRIYQSRWRNSAE